MHKEGKVEYDFYRFCKNILGYRKLSLPHKRWCFELEDKRKYYKRMLFLKPRGTYKTTVYTISYPIWRLFLNWLKNDREDINLRILIVCSTTELAVQYLREIRQQLTKNDLLKLIFPIEIVRETQQEIVLERKTIKKEPTIKAKGAFANITGEHYDLIIVDDVVNNEDRESATVRKKKIRWYQDLISILEPSGELLVVGTMWHTDDLYNYIIENNEKLDDDARYHIEIEAIIDEHGNSLFPEIYTKDDIERLKIEKGLVEFYSQYMNEPLPDETQLFKFDDFKFYEDKDRLFHELSHYLYCDPALGKEGDYAVVLVGAVKDGKLYVRDAFIRNDVTPDQVVDMIEYFDKKYNFVRIGIESNGFQSLFADAVRKRNLPVIEIKNLRNKKVRIEGIEPYIKSGMVLFRSDWNKVYPELIDQLIKFPVHRYDDCPDALEGLIRLSLRGNVLDLSGLVKSVKGVVR